MIHRLALCVIAGLCALLFATAVQAAKLRIEGVEDELKANIEAYIGPEEETGRMSFRALAQHAEEQTRAALQAVGYYHPQIKVSRKGRARKPVCVLHIDPGPPVLVRRVEIEFEADNVPPELTEFVDKNRLQKGDIFHHGRYESFKTRLLQQAMTLGYFRTAWRTTQVRLDEQENRADIHLALILGERHRFGATTIDGQGLDADLIDRFPRFRAGDWYDANKLAELHRDLVRAGWFENVRIRADPGDDPDQPVPVGIEYKLRKTNRVGIGAGFSTDIGPRVQLQWEKPWLNSHGHSLGTYLELSEIRSQLEATYIVPLRDPVTSQLAYTYGVQVEDLNDHDYWLTTLGVEHRKRLPHNWRLARGIDIERETDDFGNVKLSTTLWIPGISLARTESVGSPLIIHGWRTAAKLQFASRDLLSDASMVRGTFNAKGIYSLGDRTRVTLRGDLGVLDTDDILDIPVSLRFFSGGDQSIRGYSYESVAPRDSTGDIVGGRYRVEGSMEFDYRFAERWLVATFVDRGGSFDDYSQTEYVTGAGAGIRWLSPIGPLRLDFAWGVSRDDKPFNIHFYMGPEL